MKRPAPQPVDEEVEVVESASSNFRASSSKRQRVSILDDSDSQDETTTAGDTPTAASVSFDRSADGRNKQPLRNGTPDMVDLNNGNGLYTSTQMENDKSIAEQYEEMWDESGSEDEEMADQQHATQQVRRKQRSRPVLNAAAECGIIESVSCINFMCHTRLEVKLGPLINFIIGHNGSGKSAVLTAIQLCLGGKATATNRGQSLRSFVKQGQESSHLIVKVKNQGPAAFKNDVYGDSIIVERHFNIQGTSTFKLKNEQGKIMSTKRQELDDMLDWYALQLDNPVNVLTQDHARQFLNHSTPYDKYTLFVKGVQLEQLDNDYRLVISSMNLAQSRLQTVKEDLVVLQNRRNAAKDKFNQVRELDSGRERLRVLGRQMVWAQVEQQERELVEMEAALKERDGTIQDRKRTAVNVSNDLEKLDQTIETIKLALSEKDNEDRPLQTEMDTAGDARRKALEAVQDIISEQRDAHSAVQADERRIADHQEKVDAERRRLAAADDGSTEAKLADVEKAEHAWKNVQLQLEDMQKVEAIDSLRRDESTAITKAASAGGLLKDRRAALSAASSRLDGLQKSGQGSQQWPHSNMPALVQAIAKETRFREKPVGPACHHVRLLKPNWSSIVERFFGRSLNAFVVSNKHDSSLLLELAHRAKCDVPVMIAPSHRFDTSKTEPDASFTTVKNILEIQSEMVRNMFMAQHGMDQCILIEDANEASRVMFTDKPRNVKRCIAMHPNQRGWGMSYTHNLFGDEKIEPVSPWDRAARMKTDLEAQIRMQQETLQAQKQEVHNAEQNQKAATEHLVKCKQAIVKYEKDKKALRLEVDRAEELVTTLKEELEALRPQEGLLDAYKQNLEESQHSRTVNQRQLDLINQRRDELNDELKQKEVEVERLKRRIHIKEKEKERVTNRLAKSEEQRSKTLKEKNEALERVGDAEKEREADVTDIEDKQKVISDWSRMALEHCARIPVPENETAASIKEKHQALGRELERGEAAIGGSKEQLWRSYQDAEKDFVSAKREDFRISSLVREVGRSAIERGQRWKRFRSEISARARAEFKALLANRQFRGELQFYHEDRSLDIAVEPDSSRRDDKGRQTKTLSGGEKSFSTICMLLALWNAMGSPIRCLDEFDVFMDSANRDVSTKMLIAAARESVGRQFILITPQAMGNIHMAEDVKIIRLNDPERGQTALPFA